MTKESKVNPEEVKEVLDNILEMSSEKTNAVNDAIGKYEDYKQRRF